MPPGDAFGQLMELSNAVGRLSGLVEGLTNEVRTVGKDHAKRLGDIERRVDGLESLRDTNVEVARLQLRRVERRLQLGGLVLAAASFIAGFLA